MGRWSHHQLGDVVLASGPAAVCPYIVAFDLRSTLRTGLFGFLSFAMLGPAGCEEEGDEATSDDFRREEKEARYSKASKDDRGPSGVQKELEIGIWQIVVQILRGCRLYYAIFVHMKMNFKTGILFVGSF